MVTSTFFPYLQLSNALSFYVLFSFSLSLSTDDGFGRSFGRRLLSFSNAYRKHSTEYNSDILSTTLYNLRNVENLTSSCPVIFLVFCNLLKTPSTMEVNTLL